MSNDEAREGLRTDPIDLDRIRELVAEFGHELGTGSGIGDCTMVDTAALRALYDAVFGTGSGEDEEDDEAEYPEYPCPDDPDGQHHVGCRCDF